MYTYKNKVTGVTVTTFGKVSGADWVQVKESKQTKAATEGKEKEPDGE
jgi:hypothetical protein